MLNKDGKIKVLKATTILDLPSNKTQETRQNATAIDPEAKRKADEAIRECLKVKE